MRTDPSLTEAASFRAAALALLGDGWVSELARHLGQHHPDGARDTLDPRLVRRWSSGKRAIPPWVQAVMMRTLHRQAAGMLKAASALTHSSEEGDHHAG